MPDRSSGHVNVVCVEINVLLVGTGAGVREDKGHKSSLLQARDLRGWEFATFQERDFFF